MSSSHVDIVGSGGGATIATTMPSSSPDLTLGGTTIVVYSFDGNEEINGRKKYSASPFTNKLIMRLEVNGRSYESKLAKKNQAPKGKVPYIKVRPGNKFIGDSDLIIKYLIHEGFLTEDINAKLTAFDIAQDHAIRALVEDKLYFQLVHERYVEQYDVTKKNMPIQIPKFFKGVGETVVQQYCKLQLYMQGIGRHSVEENHRFRVESIEALEAYAARAMQMKENFVFPFYILGGESITEADFAVLGYLAAVLSGHNNPHTRELICRQGALMNYLSRMVKRHFRDYQSLLPEGAPANDERTPEFDAEGNRL